MTGMKKVWVIVAALAMVAVIGVVWFLNKETSETETGIDEGEILSAGDPMDTIAPFYNSYLEAIATEGTDPYQAGIMDEPVLGSEARADIESRKDDEIDPVLCQSVTPKRVGMKQLFSEGGEAQFQVLGRGFEEKSPRYALVSLSVVDGAWQITKIECHFGEDAPEREFSFDREGFLLKSVPEPLDSRYWHLVFEERGIMGHTAPLFFEAESVCVDRDGIEGACDENMFEDAAKAHVQGEMTESGVTVKRLRLMSGD